MGLDVDAFEEYVFKPPDYSYNVSSCRTYKRISIRKPVRTEPRHRVNIKKAKGVNKKPTHLDYLEDHILRHGSAPKDVITKTYPVPFKEDDTVPVSPGKVFKVHTEQNWEINPDRYKPGPVVWNKYFKAYKESIVERPRHPAWVEDLNVFWYWRYSSTKKKAHEPPPHVVFSWWDEHKHLELGPYSAFKDRHPRLFRNFKWPMSLEEMRKFYKPEFESYGIDFRPLFKHPGPVTDLCYRACLMNLYGRTLRPPVKLNGLILSP